ncbi:methyltransferase [Salinilacihabitans rarus]|uniref:methyltransferase n=1 Tax=Salinilacihabitans rarus TaxID=2961596 RepID=UPI0020C87DAC|nr:methyltransferase [Salinilacihabitans rarus]
MTGSTRGYLEAKRTVDDRALNRRVLDRFAAELGRLAGADGEASDGPTGEEVRIVELGAGVGTMIARLASWGLLPDRVTYRAVDRDRGRVRRARERVPAWLDEAGYDVEADDERIVATSGERRLDATLAVADAFTIDDEADAVIAAAFLDLVDLDRALPAVADLLRPGGLLYAPITFDGGTAFAPSEPADDRIERLYHRHMDEVRDAPGSSRAGRELLAALPGSGAASGSEFEVLAAGGSDWVVRPVDGAYPADEAAFLGHLLETIDGALADYPPAVLDPAVREAWVERRLAALERGDLVAVVHNLDVLGRRT